MGASTFTHTAMGRDAKEAFYKAREEAGYMYGHAGYTGTIVEKCSFIEIDLPRGKAIRQYINELIDKNDSRIDDKWGPAGCIEITKQQKAKFKADKKRWPNKMKAFVFFGWASD